MSSLSAASRGGIAALGEHAREPVARRRYRPDRDQRIAGGRDAACEAVHPGRARAGRSSIIRVPEGPVPLGGSASRS